jgi:hypothetical protein
VIKEAAVALFLVGLVAVGGAGAVAPSSWSVSFPEEAIPWETPIVFDVYGPVGAEFSVNITAQPYNASTSSVFDHQFAIPNPGGEVESSLNLTIPTSTFDIDPYHLWIGNGSATIFETAFSIVEPVNASVLDQEYGELEENLSIANDRINSLLADEQNEVFLVSILEYTVVAMVVIVVPAFLLTRTGIGDREYGRRIRLFFSKLWYGSPFREMDAAAIDDERLDTNPMRVYRCTLSRARTCKTIDRTKEEIENHVRNEHGVANPRLNVHFAVSQKTTRRMRQRFETKYPLTKQGRAAQREPVVDLSKEI